MILEDDRRTDIGNELLKTIDQVEKERLPFDMGIWLNTATTQEEPNVCGTAACLAGHYLTHHPILAPALFTYTVETRKRVFGDPVITNYCKFTIPSAEEIEKLPISEATKRVLRWSGSTTQDIPDIVQTILDLPSDEATKLFYTDKWPSEFQEEYEASITNADRLRITRERIEHWISTGD